MCYEWSPIHKITWIGLLNFTTLHSRLPRVLPFRGISSQQTLYALPIRQFLIVVILHTKKSIYY